MNSKNKITIVYNNEAKKGLKFGWGFSCLVDIGEKSIGKIKHIFDPKSPKGINKMP
jgi:metal-dependent hydrolase (beta-lactamase superfamily II)